MHHFESFLGTILKTKVGNEARVEASVRGGYLQSEVGTFSSYYFSEDVEARACYLHLSTGDIKSRKTWFVLPHFISNYQTLLMDVFICHKLFFWGLHAHVIGRLWLMTYR
ncbi:unnamed protein product [Cuscuta epithymum]|uniref:Uncharacterized protein n=1 Tax=Cuscuta epithymum TaxID=186058 RepID=A0AAV0CEL9_9ASTE|nr:unnamed protein product [Cuscuta epithymum]